MEFVHDALGLEPQREENVQPLITIGPPSDTVAEEGVVETMEEANAGKTVEGRGVQQTTHKGGNTRGPLDTPIIEVLPSD